MSEINALPVTSIHKDSLVPTDEFTKSEKELISTQISNMDSDWEKYWHDENECHYYYHKITGETRWNISSDCSLALSTSKEMSKESDSTSVSSKIDTNRETDPQITNVKNDSIQNMFLRVPPVDSPLHGRSHDAYSRLSNLAPMVTHLKLERHQIEFATRMHDWQVGALNSQYFEKVILERLERLLQGVEEQVSPAGWACKWKAETQTYNWVHLQTNQVSSTYPIQSHEQYQTSRVVHSTSTILTPPLPPLPPPPPPPHLDSIGDLDINVKAVYSEEDGANKSLASYNASNQGAQSASEKKRKKEKEPLTSGFKNKKMATLVEKWKAAEDFLSNTDWDEIRKHQYGVGSSDPESWIKEQIESGEAANNPNLEPIKGDRRQRIRNKKSDKG